MSKYNHRKVETSWQERWAGEESHRADDHSDKPKRYILDMFPYPSGDGLHVGHVESYTATDIIARYCRMRGFNVLHPQGWDAFGLPAENFAIKSGIHPALTTKKAIANFKRQINSLGFSYDWTREVNTALPGYYKWTQWLFLKLHEQGLAYRKKGKVNWCESCQTTLANEQAEGGKCDRCGSLVVQKDLEQWYFKITDFIDDQVKDGRAIKGLLSGLDGLDWPESTKTAQRNWIGRSQGAEVRFIVKATSSNARQKEVKVFTTRPDTLFGCTYMVVCPEHPVIEEFGDLLFNREAVQAYVAEARRKTELQRGDLNRDKTGVELVGITAINPANNQEVPIFTADYVLSGYGTGAIMAVPAHDERDWEFAQRYDLAVRQVVRPRRRGLAVILHGFEGRPDNNWFPWLKGNLEKLGYEVVLEPMPNAHHPKPEEWLAAIDRHRGRMDGDTLLIGHSLGAFAAAHYLAKTDLKVHGLYLVAPATDAIDWAQMKKMGLDSDVESVRAFCRAETDWGSLAAKARVVRAYLSDNDPYIPFAATHEYLNERGLRVGVIKRAGHFQLPRFDDLMNHIGRNLPFYAGDGAAINSDFLDGQPTEAAKRAMVDWLKANGAGQGTVTYRLRDWLVSRQRYWGAPIPIVYCKRCGVVPVPERDLPVMLPNDVDFKPTGESPLKRSAQFQDVKCPRCGLPARREADTMDTFVCSSWYYLRYSDPHNEAAFADPAKMRKWLPVDLYVGGAEHTVLHLLYSRFFTKFLQRSGYLDFNEPFLKLRHQGIILAEDGNKMSKSKGNVVNPDEVVEAYGADALRLYEMFMGPLMDMKPWNTKGIIGARRFLDAFWNFIRAWRQAYQKAAKAKDRAKLGFYAQSHCGHKGTDVLVEKTVKKVTLDIEQFKFNTAISQLMICLNELKRPGAPVLTRKQAERLIILLAPFAPHIAEELWRQIGHQGSVFRRAWTGYNRLMAKDEPVELVVQVNGRRRASVKTEAGLAEPEAVELAKKDPAVAKWIEGKNIVKVVYVADKLINFVVKY